jgi:GNAT superfamily N-acetyltransferase
MEGSPARLVHRNLMDVTRWGAEGSRATVEESDGELLIASPASLQFLNALMREARDGGADELLERARQFFFERGRGFVVYTWPGDPELERATLATGMFPVLERYPEMVCRSPLEPLAGELRAVGDEEDAAAYWRVCDEAYPSIGFPRGMFSQIFAPDLLLDGDRVWACIAREDGRPVACASLWLTSGGGSTVGFVGWVAALPDTRGRGLAAACTVAATNRAFELGAQLASLQASPMGEALYRRLGYEELFAYRLMGAVRPEQAASGLPAS